MLRLFITKKFKKDLSKITGSGNKDISKLKKLLIFCSQKKSYRTTTRIMH